jgi:hypothetical protein
MIQDRLKIMKRGGQDVMLGRQSFLNCAPFHSISGGCDGGDPIDVRLFRASSVPRLPSRYPFFCRVSRSFLNCKRQSYQPMAIRSSGKRPAQTAGSKQD